MGGMFNPRRTAELIDSADNAIEDTLKHSIVTTDIDHWLIHKGLTWIYSAQGGGDEWVLPAGGTFLFDFSNLSAQADTVGVTIKSLDVGFFNA